MEESKAVYHKPYLCIICVDVCIFQGDEYECVSVYVCLCTYICKYICIYRDFY